jgi:hypothetical protein
MGRPECGITGSTLEAQAQAMISHRLCAVQPGTLCEGLPGPRSATLLRVMHGRQERWGRLLHLVNLHWAANMSLPCRLGACVQVVY